MIQRKIPLFRGKSLGFERDMVTFSVKQGSFFLFSRAIVDTGCPFTILSENALKRTRIHYQNKETAHVVQVGNIQLELKPLGACNLGFRDENNQVVYFEQDVFAGIPMVKGYLAQELPSFLGKDFLNKHYLSIINKKEGIYLSFDES